MPGRSVAPVAGDKRSPHTARGPGAGPLADVESEGLRKQLAIMRHSRLQFAERRLVRAFLRPIHPGGAMLAKQRVSDIAGDLYFALL